MPDLPWQWISAGVFFGWQLHSVFDAVWDHWIDPWLTRRWLDHDKAR